MLNHMQNKARFIRLARGLHNQKSTLVPISDDIYKSIKENPNSDYYTSLFQYREHHVEQFKTTESVKGIKDVTTPKLLWDFDDAQNIESARQDALTVIQRLNENGVKKEDIRAYFSGGKGFHLEVMTDQEFSRQEFVNITFNLASDLKTFDQRINDEQRLIRAPLTKHPKSGLHKIPLEINDLKTLAIDEIRTLAEDVEGYDSAALKDELFKIALPEKLNSLRTKEAKKVAQETVVKEDLKFDTRDIDFSRCPSWLTKDRFALQEGFFYGSESASQGERNDAFMILAATYRNQGFSTEHALALLSTTAQKQSERTGEELADESRLVREVLSVVFAPGWNGGQYGSDHPLLVQTRNRFRLDDPIYNGMPLIKIEEVGQKFKNFAKAFDQNRIMTGLPSLDKKLVLTTSMAVGLLGAPGSGKTSILNLIMEHQSKNNIPSVYQSLDMADNLLYLRLLQKQTGLSVEQLLENFKSDNPDQKVLDAYAQILNNFSKVHFNFRSAMTVEQMDNDITRYKHETGINPKVIAVDYLEKVRTDYTDPTISSGMVASQLSDLAKKHDALVLVLLQPQKAAGDASQELLSMRKVKGASVIEQDLRVILTAWRYGFNPSDPSRDKFMSVGIVKNNLGETAQVDFGWHGLTGQVFEMNGDMRRELNDLRADLKAQAEQEAAI